MATINRRRVIRNAGALAALPLAAPFIVRADEPIKLKLGNDLPLSHPNTVRTQEAIASIARESGGKLEIELFANNQMGGDNDMLSQVRSGALEMFLCTGQLLSTLVPVVSVYGVSYAFSDYATVWRAMDGELGAMVRGSVEKAGLHVFNMMWDAGFRHVAAIHHPISTPDDLRGFKIRVPISPLWTSTFTALGASPVSIPFSQVYSALQTGLVDGQDVSLDGLESAKFYEVVKYGSLTHHMWEGFLLVANGKIWRTVPTDLQSLISRAFDEAAIKARNDIMKDGQTLQAALTEKGMVFNEPAPQPFRDALRKAGYYVAWKAKYGSEAWTLLEKYAGALA
jgi:TRAP-type transport system periplasmic protein